MAGHRWDENPRMGVREQSNRLLIPTGSAIRNYAAAFKATLAQEQPRAQAEDKARNATLAPHFVEKTLVGRPALLYRLARAGFCAQA